LTDDTGDDDDDNDNRLGSGHQLKHVDLHDIPLLSTTVQVVESTLGLGVILDSRLRLWAHISALCWAGYYQLRQLRSLRSADVPTCVVPRTLSSYGDGTFAAAGPRLWNSLPVQLRSPDIPTDCSDDS